MTRIAALLTAAALVLVPAQASNATPLGGPTSVLLASPDFDRTASLYHSDRLYERLQGLVQSNEDSGRVGTDGWSDTNAHAQGPLVRATWLAHDMYVWRIDRIYPKAPGGPWIATSVLDGRNPPAEEKVVWHTTSDPRGLLQVLGQLQMLDRAAQKTVPAPLPEEAAAEPQAPAAQAQVETVGTTTGWRWSLLGLLVGVLATVAAFRLVRRRGEASPRWELIDAD